MTQAILKRVLEDIQMLEPQELDRVRLAVEERLSPTGHSLQEYQALQSLVEAGLLKEIKGRRIDAGIERPLVPIQGKPLSETVIEERR